MESSSVVKLESRHGYYLESDKFGRVYMNHDNKNDRQKWKMSELEPGIYSIKTLDGHFLKAMYASLEERFIVLLQGSISPLATVKLH